MIFGYRELTGAGAVSIPAHTVQTGTISSSGVRVTGTNTKFTTDLKVGDFIFSPSLKQIRRVEHIYSDDTIEVNRAFTSNLSGVAFNRVRARIDGGVTLENIGSANAEYSNINYDNQVVSSGQKLILARTERTVPLVYDALTTRLAITPYKKG